MSYWNVCVKYYLYNKKSPENQGFFRFNQDVELLFAFEIFPNTKTDSE